MAELADRGLGRSPLRCCFFSDVLGMCLPFAPSKASVTTPTEACATLAHERTDILWGCYRSCLGEDGNTSLGEEMTGGQWAGSLNLRGKRF